MSKSNEEPALRWLFRELSNLNNGMKRNLSEYGMEELHGLFLSVTFMIALSIGSFISFQMSYDSTSFIITTFFFSAMAGAIGFILMGYILLPLYHTAYPDKSILKTLLAYQLINLLLGILLSLYFWSGFPIKGSGVVFLILAFIHPISTHLYGGKKTINELKTILNNAYIVLSILHGAIVFILKFVKLI